MNLDGDVVIVFYYLGWPDLFFNVGGFDQKIKALVNDVERCFTQDILLQALFLNGIGTTSDNSRTLFNASLQTVKRIGRIKYPL